MSDNQNTYCKLSDEEIKLEILELISKGTSLLDMDTERFNQVKEIFQWVKGE